MGLILLARHQQPGFQKRIHGIGTAVVHSVVPMFLRSCSSLLLSFSRVPRSARSFYPYCRSFLSVSHRHMWRLLLLGNLTSLGLACDLPAPSIIESELNESPMRKVQDIFCFAKRSPQVLLEFLGFSWEPREFLEIILCCPPSFCKFSLTEWIEKYTKKFQMYVIYKCVYKRCTVYKK